MKWGVLEPARGDFAWKDADAVVDFAASHDQRVRGHTLVWHVQNPGWLGVLDARELRSAMRAHVRTVVGRYRGRIADWDVVNEVVARRRRAAPRAVPRQARQALHRRRVRMGARGRPGRAAVDQRDRRRGDRPEVRPRSTRWCATCSATACPSAASAFRAHFSEQGVPATLPREPRALRGARREGRDHRARRRAEAARGRRQARAPGRDLRRRGRRLPRRRGLRGRHRLGLHGPPLVDPGQPAGLRRGDAAGRRAARQARLHRRSGGGWHDNPPRARTAALPLPVRADGPARAAPEVPGLRAGDRLVRRQPAGADGRLLPDVRRRAEAGVHARALPAVPDDRDRRLDLLLPVADERGAVAAGAGVADPQGALPARDDPRRRRDGAGRHVRDRLRAGGDRDAGDPRLARRRAAGAAAGDRGAVRVHARAGVRRRDPARLLPRRRADPLGGAAALVLPLARSSSSPATSPTTRPPRRR